MGPRLRKFALIVHLTASVGWIGAVVAYMVLDLAVATQNDVRTLRAAYIAMDLVAAQALVPLALATFVTGLVMSLWTKWGLFRHYWVIISLVLTIVAVAVLMIETQTIAFYAREARDPATTDEELRAMSSTLVHSIGGLVVLMVVLVLNVLKPRGLTPFGWRKQQEELANGSPP